MLEALGELTAGLAELRDLARGLHPAVLSDHGLEHGLRALAQRAAVPVELETALPEQRLPMAVEAGAYFVVSEALTNVDRYAEASRATVRVEERDGQLDVMVDDDGVGGADAGAGSGLQGLRDRLAALNGTLEIDSRPGLGTQSAGATPFPRGERAQEVGGRRSAHGRAVSSCAASDSSVASSFGRPTIWTASGRPVRGEAGGHRRGGLAGRVPEHVERHPRRSPTGR